MLDAVAPVTPQAEPIAPASDPFRLFATWLDEARATEPNDPNAMTLATAGHGGAPAARIVLLKALDDRGFTFYTNKQSRKGDDLRAHGHAALLFHWKTRRRQVRVEGTVEDVTDAEADTYFASRARVSRLGALASDQSRPLPSRAVLQARVAELDARYPGDSIPRPPHWSGYRVLPTRIEFWQDMPYRLHDRRVYTRETGRTGGDWTTETLYP